MEFLLLLAIPVIAGLIPAYIAQYKGYSFVGWWVFGALLFIVALPWALLMQPNERGLATQRAHQCPYCAEFVEREAILCRWCGRDIDRSSPSAPVGNATVDEVLARAGALAEAGTPIGEAVEELRSMANVTTLQAAVADVARLISPRSPDKQSAKVHRLLEQTAKGSR